jgi:hypothetical protein
MLPKTSRPKNLSPVIDYNYADIGSIAFGIYHRIS